MPKLLVTCCGYGGGLFAIDLEREQAVREVWRNGATGGFCFHQGYWWVIDYCKLRVLNTQLETVQVIDIDRPFPGADIHDICSDGEDRLYLALTRCNAVEVYETGRDFSVRRVGALFFDEPHRDRRHVNSVLATERGLYISMFNILAPEMSREEEPKWADVHRGGIAYIPKDRIDRQLWEGPVWFEGNQPRVENLPPIAEFGIFQGNVQHPHSLGQWNGHIHYCESVSRKLWRACPETEVGKPVAAIPRGYARGQDVIGKGDFVVGGSNSGNHPSAKFPTGPMPATIYLLGRYGIDKTVQTIEIDGAYEVFQVTSVTDDHCPAWG